MAKEPATGKKSPSASSAAPRTELARLDRELLKLINQRAKKALEVSKLAAHDPPASDDTEAHLADLVEHNRGPLSAECVRAVFRELSSGSRALYRQIRVAFLGPAYSYSHEATLERFGSSV
jgi:chorismate mutase/prephenate dehydratase